MELTDTPDINIGLSQVAPVMRRAICSISATPCRADFSSHDSRSRKRIEGYAGGGGIRPFHGRLA
jgi:hypothetical protein